MSGATDILAGRRLGAGLLRRKGYIPAYLVVVAVIMFLVPEYRVLLLSQSIALAVAVAGLDVIAGYGGELALGHSAFFGAGAYTSVILVSDHNVPYWATLLPAALVGWLFGLIAGLPALRVRGNYLGLVTLSFSVVFPIIVTRFDSFTGGDNGKLLAFQWNLPVNGPSWLSQTTVNFLFISLVGGAVIAGTRRVMRSSPGRLLVALRDRELAASAGGVNVARHKTIAFAASAMVTSVGGSLFALSVGSVAPGSFSFLLSIQLITALIVGGACTAVGPIIGGLFIVFMPYYTADWGGGQVANIVYGALLIVVIFVVPNGLAGLPAAVRAAWRRRHPQRPIPSRRNATVELAASDPESDHSPSTPRRRSDTPVEAQ